MVGITKIILVGLIMLVIASIAIRWVGLRRSIPDLGTPEWIQFQQSLPYGAAGDDAIRRYLLRTRVWRFIGVVFAVGIMIAASTHGSSIDLPTALFSGWFAAGVVPELFARNRRAPSHRVAVLDHRDVRRYVTPTARRWLVASGAAAATMLVYGAVDGGHPHWRRRAVILALAVVVAAVAVGAIRRIAHRAQPASDATEISVDEAIRKLATTRVVSGWAALQFIAAANLAGPLDGLNVGVRWLTKILITGCVLSVLACWAWVPTRVDRRTGRSAPTPSATSASSGTA